jgi:predicted hydrocarbon binding protein
MTEPPGGVSGMFESFAEAISTLEKLTKMETKITAALDDSRVPWKESRKLLKCMNPDQMSNTTLFQFMQNLFSEAGIGRLEISDVGRFQLTFIVKDCGVCNLYHTKEKGKVCFIIADAILKFFVKDLDLPCSVEETRCSKEGLDICEFKADLQPLGVYKIALDDLDRALIGDILGGRFDSAGFAKDNEMDEAEVNYRLKVLESYQIVDSERNVTEIGSTYYKFAQGLRALEEDFEPPWKGLSKITSSIAAKNSFAEAICETFNSEPFITVDSSDVVNLAEEAKKSKSFAELIAKHVKSMG